MTGSAGWWYVAGLAAGLGVLPEFAARSRPLLIPPIWRTVGLTRHRAPIGRTHLLGFLGVVTAVNPPVRRGLLRQPVFLRYFFWEHNVLRFVQPFDP